MPQLGQTFTMDELFAFIDQEKRVAAARGRQGMPLTAEALERLDRRIDQVHEEGAADRRVFQVAMDDFRKEMQKLDERQSRVEGRLEATGD